MKKYMSMLLMAVVATVFSACSNDDIEIISSGITVTVKPVSVVEKFKNPVVEGQLKSFSQYNRLRTTVLVYNQNQKLVARESEFLPNYEATMRKNLQLTKGTYTFVAITDVVEYVNGNITHEYWQHSGEETLQSLKLTFNASQQVFKNAILGISSQQETIADGGRDIELKPQPAGGVIVVKYNGIHKFSNVQLLAFQTNRIPGSVTLGENNSITLETAIPKDNNNQDTYYTAHQFDPRSADYADYDQSAIYYFAFPSSDVRYRYVYYTGVGNAKGLGFSLPIEQGGEYEFMLDLESVSSLDELKPTFQRLN